jgi:hypothetical protein
MGILHEKKCDFQAQHILIIQPNKVNSVNDCDFFLNFIIPVSCGHCDRSPRAPSDLPAPLIGAHP